MKHLLFLLTLLFVGVANAHDEGHGPKISGNPGERAVILAKEIDLGAKAGQVFAASMQKAGEDKIEIQIRPSFASGVTHDTTKFSKEAKALLKSTSGRKKAKAKDFNLALSIVNGKAMYSGEIPHVGAGLYELEVKFKHGSEEFFVAFPDVEGHSH